MIDKPRDGSERDPRKTDRAKAAQYRETAKRKRDADPELREKWLQRKREEAKRYQARRKAKEERQARNRERVDAWRKANPERVAERQRRWTEENRDKVRAHQLDYYYRHHDERLVAMRDRNAARRADPAQREKQRKYVADNRERLNARQRERRSTPEGREKHRREQREYRQREKRRRELGLPPRPRHRSTVNERARNEAAAEEFFSRPRTQQELIRLEKEGAAIRVSRIKAERTDEQIRADIAATVRENDDAMRRVNVFLHSSSGRRLQEEVRMDSVARQLRGLAPYADLTDEARRRASLALASGSSGWHEDIDSIRGQRSHTRRIPPEAPRFRASARHTPAAPVRHL